MLRQIMLKLFSTKYRRAAAEVEKARKLIELLASTGSISTVRR